MIMIMITLLCCYSYERAAHLNLRHPTGNYVGATGEYLVCRVAGTLL